MAAAAVAVDAAVAQGELLQGEVARVARNPQQAELAGLQRAVERAGEHPLLRAMVAPLPAMTIVEEIVGRPFAASTGSASSSV